MTRLGSTAEHRRTEASVHALEWLKNTRTAEEILMNRDLAIKVHRMHFSYFSNFH